MPPNARHRTSACAAGSSSPGTGVHVQTASRTCMTNSRTGRAHLPRELTCICQERGWRMEDHAEDGLFSHRHGIVVTPVRGDMQRRTGRVLSQLSTTPCTAMLPSVIQQLTYATCARLSIQEK